jgi:ArsR family transcriptional regulator, arsenate/arsenite/antimonite-responsive transcriptional repressor
METMSALRSLAALAQDTRLRVFRVLVEHGPAGLPAGDIGRKLDLPPATLSFHIKELASAGLVAARQRGRYIYYSTDFATMRELVAYLSENCCRAGVRGDDHSIACASDCAPQVSSDHTLFAVPKPNVRPKRRAA